MNELMKYFLSLDQCCPRSLPQEVGVLPLSSALSGIPRDANHKDVCPKSVVAAFVASRGVLDNGRHAVREKDLEGEAGA